MFTKRTLQRRFPVTKYPKTRRYIQIVEELESITRRAKNLVEEIHRIESDSRALEASRK